MHFSKFTELVEIVVCVTDIYASRILAAFYKLYVVNLGEFSESYMGYETWMPKPPRAENPRSTFNPASLAYLGDCIYEVSIYFSPMLSIEYWSKCLMQMQLSEELFDVQIFSILECRIKFASPSKHATFQVHRRYLV